MNELARGIARSAQPRTGRIFFAAFAGILFGLFVLLIFKLPLKFTYYLIVGPMVLFIAILTGKIKRFFQGLLIFIIPIHSATHFFRRPYEYGVGGLDFGDLDIILILLYLIWIYELIIKRRGGLRLFPKITVPALGLVGMYALSMIPARDPYLALFETIRIFKAVLLYLYIVNHIESKREIAFVVVLLLAGLFLQSLIAFAQKAMGKPLGLFLLGEKEELGTYSLTHEYYAAVTRPGATLGTSHGLAKYVVSLIPLSIALLFTEIKLKYKLASGLVFSCAFIVLVLTLSRTGWIGFVGSVAFLFLLILRAKLVSLRTIMAMVVVAVILAGVGLSFFALVESRLLSEPPQKAARARMLQTQRALFVVRAHPLLGVGARNYGMEIQRLYNPHLGASPFIQLHNTYLITAAETGVLGLLLLLWLLSSIFLQGLRNLRWKDPFIACVNIGILAGMAAMWIYWIASPQWLGKEPIFWVLTSLVVASWKICGEASMGHARERGAYR